MKPSKIMAYMSVVVMLLSFMITYSVKLTKNGSTESGNIPDAEWIQKQELSQKILDVKTENQKLGDDLFSINQKVSEIEKKVSERESIAKDSVNDLNNLRLWVGVVPVSGPGVVVNLIENKKLSTQGLTKEGIVREEHIRQVVNELFSAGAEAISINGQRLAANSSIIYQGFTLLVNGVKTQAPFEISAIGDPVVLETAMKMAGGVYQNLQISAKIQISIEKKDNLTLPAFSGNHK